MSTEIVSSTDQSQDPKWMKVDTVQHGYNHTIYQGHCGPDVTVQDVEARYYHPHFGGRGAWVNNGRWGATCHDD